jgi:hypothetical protein
MIPSAPRLVHGADVPVVRVPFGRLIVRVGAIIVTTALFAGCGTQDDKLREHREKFESLGATTRLIGEAWLAGRLSGTFAVTALEQALVLAENERSRFATVPQLLIDPQGARLSQAGEALSRLIAALTHDVAATDAPAVRRRLSDIPIKPSSTR